ncbi:helix-turn-helix transcriptional regulator [Defluviitalea saccharophila]|uniref:Helix-turn-helix transcriptional regulator n=1 Tax=Defluviitalea saccharophila TaxID=879970 RepID=A0ABZ2Y5Q2_9FIRM
MFGLRLKELRTEKNLTQKDIANLINLSPSTVGMYEQGRRDPDTETVKTLADYFNVSVDYLLGRSNDQSVTNKLTEKDEKDIAKELDELMEKLKNEEGLMFDGNPADEETLKALRDALEMGMRYAKAVNKKYTPKKFRKDKNE